MDKTSRTILKRFRQSKEGLNRDNFKDFEDDELQSYMELLKKHGFIRYIDLPHDGWGYNFIDAKLDRAIYNTYQYEERRRTISFVLDIVLKGLGVVLATALAILTGMLLNVLT